VRSSSAPRRAVLALALALASAHARAQSPSTADLATARTAFNEGMDLREQGDVAGAIPKLEAAYAYAKTPITGLELGRTYMTAGRLVDAYETLRAAVRLPVNFEETERTAAARREAPLLIAQLEPRIPSLKIAVKLQPGQRASVRVDDKPVPEAGLASARRLDPGRHTVTARAGDGPPLSREVTLAEGEKKEIELAPEWVAPKNPENLSEIRGTNPLVYLGLAGGAVSLTAATALFVVANSRAANADELCGQRFCPPKAAKDDETAHGLINLSGFFMLATVSFGAVMIFGITHPTKQLVPTGPAPAAARVTPVLGPGRVGLEGTF
jgi:tetratricopeptide (TPR) repeat protein